MGRHGENIRERADGRWEARVVQGRPINGKTNFKYLYGRTYRDVRQKRIAFLMTISSADEGQKEPHQSESPDGTLPLLQDMAASAPGNENGVLPLLQGTAVPGNADGIPPTPQGTAVSGNTNEVLSSSQGITVRQVTADWLQHKKPSVKESTFACYTVMVENHILPRLGSICVKDLTSEIISDFLTERKKTGRIKDGTSLSDKTIADLKAIVKQILSYAQSRGLLEKMPACPAVTAKQPPISVLTKAEQEKIEETVRREDTPFTLGILLSLYGGPRIGETCALRWKDFDFENETVQISRTVSRIQNTGSTSGPKTKIIISTPKTECSVRTIPLPSKIFTYLRERRQDDSKYVLTGTEKYMEPRVCRSRYKRFLKRAGVANHTYHSLRHTYATRCVEKGVDFKSLSEIMGHSDVKITMQRYVHPTLDFKKEQVNKLQCF